ncbi:MAG: shikimate dehydrogenase [Alphaproteobacteria bacterium]|nr:shikimate dehydrogenase [Alphaproteobacteria bacterium]
MDKSNFYTALIGEGIQNSRTPKMHMEEGAALGIQYRYDLIDTQNLTAETHIEQLLKEAEASGCNGVNITHPFKKAAIPFLDNLSDAAQAVQAVNTVLFKDGKRYGHNTDYWGFAEAFKHNMAGVECKNVLLIGAGGAGAAVANALIDQKIDHLMIYDENQHTSQDLANRLRARTNNDKISIVTDVVQAVNAADGLINATPIGMAAHSGTPIPIELLSSHHWVIDIIYFPLETEFLAAAKTLGCKVMDGSDMAIYQAVRAFELFTGLKPYKNRMRATFDAFNR